MKDNFEFVSDVDSAWLAVHRSYGVHVSHETSHCTVGELRAFVDRCGGEIVDKGVPESMRVVMTSLARDLDAVTKNLTECQQLNTKQVLEIRELCTENEELATQLHQAKLPPVEGTIFEDRDTWVKRALEAEAKYNSLVKAVVPPFEWKMVCVGDGMDIHHVGVREYHAEIQHDKTTGRWVVGVWSFDIPIKTVFETTGYDLLELKRQVEDVITNAIIEGLCSST